MLADVSDMWSPFALEKHQAYVDALIDAQAAMPLPWGNKKIHEFVVRHRGALSVGDVDSIGRSIVDFESSFPATNPKLRARAIKKFESVLSYSNFAKKDSNDWCAYDLCNNANYRICPYCQQAYAMTVIREESGRRFRPTLDHYYPKSRFPFLSLAIHNLVPSCYTCNSSLKGSKDFYRHKHLHPYSSDAGIGFSINMREYSDGRAQGSGRWKASVISDGTSVAYRNAIKTFAISERYDVLENEIARFAESAYEFYLGSHRRYDEVLKETDVEVGEVVRLNFDEKMYKNEMLGRLKRDIVLQIKGAVGWRGANHP